MRLRRAIAAVAASAVAVVPLGASSAGADADSFPSAIDAIVNGDVTEYQWMLPAVNASEAHTEATGSGVTVAVIDTGVDSTHPDLEGRVLPGAMVKRNETTEKLELVPATIEETSDDWLYGHGTHVSGIVAGDDDGEGITGIAPDASIMPVHVFPRRTGIGAVQFWKLVAQAIDFSTAQGADVINMSLGGQSSGIVPSERTAKYLEAIGLLCAAVDNAKAAGTVVVASAGNDGAWGNPENIPASCDGTFTVAALAPSLDRTFWSSFDAAVDISAPGEDILSADSSVADRSDTPHQFLSGTSMASPVVAGAAALVIEQHPGWTPDEVQDQLTSTAKDLGVTGRDPNYGWGIVDAAAAVGAAAPSPKKQNFFSTWYEGSYGGEAGESVVSWMTPAADPVTGYTVKVYTSTTTATYDVDGTTVRADVLLPPGAWYTVTAHTTSGDVTSYPGSRYTREAGDRPHALKDTSMQRKGDSMVIRWDRPRDKEDVDKIRVIVDMRDGGAVQKKLRIDQSEAFPTGTTVKLPRSARWDDAYAYLVLYNKDEDGNTVGANWMRVKGQSPAIYGTHVKAVDQAGARAVEVTGAMSYLNMRRVCGKNACAGESAVLVVDYGRQNKRFNVTFTERGVFHKMIGVERGTESLRMRIEGPKRLDSGPFVRVKFDTRGGGDPCIAGTLGC
jgi:subtilisin family serine protease